MNNYKLLDCLNDKQREAVTTQHNNILILAGAGSGKTRVLVYRIAWLLAVKQYSSKSIIAVTFTNKAALEMRNRINQLIDNNQNEMWIGTFHGLAYRLLRIHYIDASLPYNFQIIDADDQLRILKRLFKTMNIDYKKCNINNVLWYINDKKDKGLRPEDINGYANSIENIYLHIYKKYQETCNKSGMVDFAELLLRVHELWINNPNILHHYSERFTNVLVDEFQDTSMIQYLWISMLKNSNNRIMIVGDDDQSIYGWRCGQTENIKRFMRDFSGVKTIRLEQNYRSTNNILKSANLLISNNNSRLGKNLWTNDDNGEQISIYCALNELDEANFVVKSIIKSYEKTTKLSDYAILYRNNSQSRLLEEVLLQNKIPYYIYGGIRFFDRQEIKDILAYLRLIFNRKDDTAYERIINKPTRGIGDRTLNIVRDTAKKKNMTLWESTCELFKTKMLTERANSALQCFCKLIDSLENEIANMTLDIQTDIVIKNSGILLEYKKEKNEIYQTRMDNIKELLIATREFQHQFINKDTIPLQEFLIYSALESNDSYINEKKNSVQLMTLHSSKGLEFKEVFIVGMEEGIFPNHMSLNKNEQIEEERRLAYVGITRAMNKLTMTYAESRKLYGKQVYNRHSRFIDELPKSCIKMIRLQNTNNNYTKKHIITPTMIDNHFTIGQIVTHPKFGKGTIINLRGNGVPYHIQVFFQKFGTKWLVSSHAKLALL